MLIHIYVYTYVHIRTGNEDPLLECRERMNRCSGDGSLVAERRPPFFKRTAPYRGADRSFHRSHQENNNGRFVGEEPSQRGGLAPRRRPGCPRNGLLNPHRKFPIDRLLNSEARQPFQLIDQKRLAVLTPNKARQYLCPAGVGFSFGQVIYPSP
jgi:hypothetical protein